MGGFSYRVGRFNDKGRGKPAIAGLRGGVGEIPQSSFFISDYWFFFEAIILSNLIPCPCTELAASGGNSVHAE